MKDKGGREGRRSGRARIVHVDNSRVSGKERERAETHHQHPGLCYPCVSYSSPKQSLSLGSPISSRRSLVPSSSRSTVNRCGRPATMGINFKDPIDRQRAREVDRSSREEVKGSSCRGRGGLGAVGERGREALASTSCPGSTRPRRDGCREEKERRKRRKRLTRGY